MIDVHYASLTSQGVQRRVFYRDGHPSRYQPRPTGLNRDLQIRLRERVRVFQCVPGAHVRLREAVASTRSVVKISSPS